MFAILTNKINKCDYKGCLTFKNYTLSHTSKADNFFHVCIYLDFLYKLLMSFMCGLKVLKH